jgi:hypothetical protein
LPCVSFKDNESIISILDDRKVRGSSQRDWDIEKASLLGFVKKKLKKVNS